MNKRKKSLKSSAIYRIHDRPKPLIKRNKNMRVSQQALLSLQEAVSLAGDKILDIIMELDIVVSDEWIQEVMLDLCSRQAVIKSQFCTNGKHVIRTNLRLCNMIGYSTHLAQVSQGTGLFQMRLFKGEDQ